MMHRQFTTLALIAFTVGSFAEEPEKLILQDKTAPGAEFRVYATSSISGEITPPAEPGKQAAKILISGKSQSEYAERILKPTDDLVGYQSLRVYEKLRVGRTSGDRKDQLELRPTVKRIVLLKRGNSKVPFSPDAPLLWGEIDLIRTEIILSQLNGILPKEAISPTEQWEAQQSAIHELTDFDTIDGGKLVCKLEKRENIGPRDLCHISFVGKIDGVNEDGPASQELVGKLIFDKSSGYITYLTLKGVHSLKDEKGQNVGKIEGSFELTRIPLQGQVEVADSVVKKLNTTPDDTNTLLLHQEPSLKLSFDYSRRWRISRTTTQQITIDGPAGAGILVTVSSRQNTLSVADFRKEALQDLQKREATIHSSTGPELLENGKAWFAHVATIGKSTVTMVYVVCISDDRGVTLAARLPGKTSTELVEDVKNIAKSLKMK
ncbi:MAG: hypothetical protein R3B84_08930 [Zavarzinella sp.]